MEAAQRGHATGLALLPDNHVRIETAHSIDRVLGKENERRFDVQAAAVNRVGAAVGNAGVEQAAADACLDAELASAGE